MELNTTSRVFWFQNVDTLGKVIEDRYCDHCANNGIVLLDNRNEAVPCPACMIGSVRNRLWSGDENDRYWNDKRNPADESWENGLTVTHRYICGYRIVEDDGASRVCKNLTVSSSPCEWCERRKRGERIKPPQLPAALRSLLASDT